MTHPIAPHASLDAGNRSGETSMSTEVAEVARGLTEAQRRRLRGDLIVLRNRHDTRVALNLARRGLAERGRHLNQFVWTPFGQQVRARLMKEDGDA